MRKTEQEKKKWPTFKKAREEGPLGSTFQNNKTGEVIESGQARRTPPSGRRGKEKTKPNRSGRRKGENLGKLPNTENNGKAKYLRVYIKTSGGEGMYRRKSRGGRFVTLLRKKTPLNAKTQAEPM